MQSVNELPMIDILMITHNRPAYTALSLGRLLETCDETTRVWIWHNGEDRETLDAVKPFLSDSHVYRFHHSPENVKLTIPTNWLWKGADGEFLSKVDDDCLLPDGWVQTLRSAHQNYEGFGILGCWRFRDEDFVPELANRKIREFPGGHQVLENFWVQGSGYLMKRRCVETQGLLRPGQSFTGYCIDLALKGYTNGWYYPFIPEEHLDDPRSPLSALKDDKDFQERMPLSAARTGARTIGEWQDQIRQEARSVQAASVDPAYYVGWRKQLRRGRRVLERFF
jgi:glycosyltransferase involved in cell wall biosynthesis